MEKITLPSLRGEFVGKRLDPLTLIKVSNCWNVSITGEEVRFQIAWKDGETMYLDDAQVTIRPDYTIESVAAMGCRRRFINEELKMEYQNCRATQEHYEQFHRVLSSATNS